MSVRAACPEAGGPASGVALRRLLVLLPASRFGGTERHTAQLAAHLGSWPGLEVSLAAEPALLPALRAACPAGLPVPRLLAAAIGWQDGVAPAENAARQQEAAEALLAAAAPDLVLLPLPWPNAGLGLMPLLAARRLPRLVVVHLAPDGAAPPGLAEALPRLDAAGAAWAAVAPPGARRAERFFGLPAGRVAVVDNPAPPPPAADRALLRHGLRAALGLPAGAPLLLFVGRLERLKGAALLPAIAEGCGMALAVAGAGPLRAELDRQAAAGGGLRMLGQIADPTPWYQAADALLLPSALEGLPLVFLEAAAAHCPVVATAAALEGLGEAAPALARLVAQPSAAAFIPAIRALLADPEGAAALAARAAAEAARRGWPAILPRWLGLLRAAPLLAASSTETRA